MVGLCRQTLHGASGTFCPQPRVVLDDLADAARKYPAAEKHVE
jgi:hypothetical protein